MKAHSCHSGGRWVVFLGFSGGGVGERSRQRASATRRRPPVLPTRRIHTSSNVRTTILAGWEGNAVRLEEGGPNRKRGGGRARCGRARAREERGEAALPRFSTRNTDLRRLCFALGWRMGWRMRCCAAEQGVVVRVGRVSLRFGEVRCEGVERRGEERDCRSRRCRRCRRRRRLRKAPCRRRRRRALCFPPDASSRRHRHTHTRVTSLDPLRIKPNRGGLLNSIRLHA
jgi:hypothetical protein